MAINLSVRPSRAIFCRDSADFRRPRLPARRLKNTHLEKLFNNDTRRLNSSHRSFLGVLLASSRADDSSAPSEMSVENALKLLGVSEGASFDDILRAKKSILAGFKDDDQDSIALVEAAYDMLLMQSFSQRRAGKVVNNSIRYADVKPVAAPRLGSAPKWLQATMKNSPVSIESPSTTDLGIQAGVYGALMVLTYANGASTSSTGLYGGADVSGLIVASSFAASLYFMSKNNVKLGKATLITIGGLAVGAVVGAAVENWLQVDIVPFLGVHSPATVNAEMNRRMRTKKIFEA